MEAEKVYIIHGVQDNLRNDGRSCLDYRIIELETDIISNSNGSAMVKVGDTKVIAGVKAELTSPLPHCPNKGWIEVSVESTPHADPEFEGRGGDDFASDVSQLLSQVCNNEKLVDLKKLCVIPNQQVWVLYVDIMVIGYGGNLIDVASIATKAALFNTKIQSVSVKTDDNNVPEIEFSEDPYDVFYLDVTNLPSFITLYRVGSEYIVDATREEEACSKAKLLLAVSPVEVVSMKELGGPGSLHIESINDVIEIGLLSYKVNVSKNYYKFGPYPLVFYLFEAVVLCHKIGQEMGIKLQKKLNEMLELEKKTTKNKKCLL